MFPLVVLTIDNDSPLIYADNGNPVFYFRVFISRFCYSSFELCVFCTLVKNAMFSYSSLSAIDKKNIVRTRNR